MDLDGTHIIKRQECIIEDNNEVIIIETEKQQSDKERWFDEREKIMKENVDIKIQTKRKLIESEHFAMSLKTQLENDRTPCNDDETFGKGKYCYITENTLNARELLHEISKISKFSDTLKLVCINRYYESLVGIDTELQEKLNDNKPYFDQDNKILYLRLFKLQDNWYQNLYTILSNNGFYNILLIMDCWPLPNSTMLAKDDYDKYSKLVLTKAEKILISLPSNMINNLTKSMSYKFKDISSNIEYLVSKKGITTRGIYKIKSQYQIKIFELLNSTSALNSENIHNNILKYFPSYSIQACRSDLKKMLNKGIISQKQNKGIVKGKKSMYVYYVNDDNRCLFYDHR